MFDGYNVIDVHGHLSAPPELYAFAYSLIHNRSVIIGRRYEVAEAAMKASQDAHVKLLDDRKIDVQFLSPRPYTMMHFERTHVVDQWTTTTNDAIHQAC